MSKYKEIKGFKVQTLATDTAASAVATGTWASGGALPAAKYIPAGSAGTQTSNLVAGGATAPPANSNQVNTSFEYDGSSWTAGGALNTTRFAGGGFGASNTAAVIAGGSRSPGSAQGGETETYNGTAFTEVADLNQIRGETYGGAGTSTAGIIYGGRSPPSTNRANAENWNGSSWTETGDLNTARAEIAGTGESYTAAIAVGGYTTTAVANVETWNGSSWTEVSDINTAKYNGGASGGSPSAIFFGGNIQPGTSQTQTEFWDGSSWTEVADLSTARWGVGKSPSGTSASGLCSGGNTGSATTATEEFTASSDFTKINLGQVYYNSGSNAFKVTEQPVPGGTWASSGALNTGRGNAGSSGTQTANLFFGGDAPALTPETVTLTEQYNGTSWTEVADLNVARSQMFFSNQGTQTAALSATGNPVATKVESWNGSSWTESTALNTGRRNGASFGTQTAMLGTGGYNTAYQTLTEQWNGSSWTEVANCPDPKFISRGGGGTTTAGIIAGSYPNGDVDSSQLWNGSAWTNGPNINTGRSGIAFSATSQSSALAHGGGVGAPQAGSALCEFYNGTSWSELNDMAEASQSGCGAGSSVAGIHIGGYDPGSLTTTEEWTVPEANSTITVS